MVGHKLNPAKTHVILNINICWSRGRLFVHLVANKVSDEWSLVVYSRAYHTSHFLFEQMYPDVSLICPLWSNLIHIFPKLNFNGFSNLFSNHQSWILELWKMSRIMNEARPSRLTLYACMILSDIEEIWGMPWLLIITIIWCRSVPYQLDTGLDIRSKLNNPTSSQTLVSIIRTGFKC